MITSDNGNFCQECLFKMDEIDKLEKRVDELQDEVDSLEYDIDNLLGILTKIYYMVNGVV